MQWFTAVLVMECRVGRAKAELWDEQVRLIRADGDRHAFAEAQRLGKAEEHQYENSAGETVRWRFVGLGELQELGAKTVRSGVEVFSMLSRDQPRTLQKRQLNVFWSRRVLHKTASELLEEELRPFAPR